VTRFRPTLTRLDDRITPTVLPNGFSESLLTGGLTAPTGLAVAPDGRLFVTEQAGTLRVIKGGALLPTPFLTLPVDSQGERGLLGVALDPDFGQNGYVYVYHTVPGAIGRPPFNRVTRVTAAGDVAAPGSEVAILNLESLSIATNHNGGGLHFGPDGKLYVGVGENANPANSQSITNRLGKILRINPDGTIPDDNPAEFPGIPGATQGVNRAIWAVGLRNPFAFSFHEGTGRLFINDVGSGFFEEVNEGQAGANYGWPLTEGDFDPQIFPELTRPVFAYGRPGTGNPLFTGTAITGGTFYDPPALAFPAEYVGAYFFTDFTGGWINRLDPQTGAVTNFASSLTGLMPVALAADRGGDLLYLARGVGPGQGAVYSIRFNGGSGPFAGAGQSVVVAGTGAGGGPTVAVFDAATGTALARFFAFDPAFKGGVRVATADVSGDRVPDLVAGAGPGGGPHVRVFDGATGQPSYDFFAFEPTFAGGVYVAAADFDRDGYADLVVSADVGGGPRVRVLSGRTGETITDFFAFETTFTGGVRVSAADVNGDGVPDLIVSAGFGGGPRVAVFDGRDLAAGLPVPGRLGPDFFAFEDTLCNGAFVAAADLTRDGFADLITGAGPGGAPRVTAFGGAEFLAGRQTRLADFFAGDTEGRTGVTVGSADADGNGVPDVLAAPAGGPPRITAYAVAGGLATPIREFDPFPDFAGGVFVG
jgi:glucose/arabinose dehydrogenase